MTLLGVRIGASVVLLVVVSLLLVKRQAVRAHLERFLLEPSAPTNLAILRAMLFGALARVTVQTRAAWWAAVPTELRTMPPGWQWLSGALPLNGPLVHALQQLLVLTSLLAAFGVLTRITAPLAALLAVYVLGIPSFVGQVSHVDHALVLMTLVVAASPSGDALSVDRLVSRSRGLPVPGPSSAYTLPIRLSWLLLATVYLFPGVWKIWNSGDLWLSGERMLWDLRDEWGQRDNFVPPFRIDEQPLLLQGLAMAWLLFEVGFVFALFNRYTRVAAALCAVAFHLGARSFLGIKVYPFLPLVLLIDFPTFGAYEHALPQAKSMVASAIVGGTLLFAQTWAGLAQIDSWPIGLHPKLDERTGGALTGFNYQLALEPRADVQFDEVGRTLLRLGSIDSYVRLFVEVDRDIRRGAPQPAKTRALVRMMRDAGVRVDAGDHIALYAARWNVYPLGERDGLQRTLERRYRVMEDGSLQVVSKEANP